MNHFAKRCAELGVPTDDPAALQTALSLAIIRHQRDGADDHIEHVQDLPDGRSIWRFFLPASGPYYLIASPKGHPMTIITQTMLAGYKDRRKRYGRGKRNVS